MSITDSFLPEAKAIPDMPVWRKHGHITFNVIPYGDGARLSWINVHPAFEGKGFASSFMHLLCQWADENEVPLTLEAFSKTYKEKLRLVRFYKKFGFESRGGWEMRREFSRLHM